MNRNSFRSLSVVLVTVLTFSSSPVFAQQPKTQGKTRGGVESATLSTASRER